MIEPEIRVKISMPARAKCTDPELTCDRCAGVGLEIKRTYRRKSGAISKVVYVMDRDCVACDGTGFRPGLL
ncbi:MAG TPA: hypothetical protein VGN60_09055 [Devosia sp.]|jgi:hypothetical protein|nr:hypothetical protein [Devosia sp.]